jgi:uncharacterized protein (DUF58 family)
MAVTQVGMATEAEATTRQVDLELRWRTSELTRILFTCAAVALAAALISGRWQLVVFAAPLIGVLSSVSWQPRVPRLSVRATPELLRCFEGDQVQTVVEMAASEGGTAVALSVEAVPGMQVEVLPESTPHRQCVRVSADRWGRYPLRVEMNVVAPGGLLTATASAEIAEVFVFPVVPPPSTGLPRTDMPDRLGTHLTRYVGPGVEYADIRAYVPGDQLRTVNWSVSARRGSLHVTQRLTDRSVDVAVLVDLSQQPPGPATHATQRAVEGAVQVVQSALRAGDRAGVIGLGGQQPRWLGLDIGQRQFYRVLDTVLGAGDGFRTMTGTLTPQAAVPPGAVIVGFSTLLDADFGMALMDLCKRGHTVVVIDVLEAYPLEDEHDDIVKRMWKLQRAAMYRDMGAVGVDVVPWPAEFTLDVAMRVLPQGRRGRGRRRYR